MYYVYLIYSLKYGIFYIGQTDDLTQRFVYHNSGRSKFTKDKKPWILLAFKSFQTRSEAMKEERRLKMLKNKRYILKEFGLNPDDFQKLFL